MNGLAKMDTSPSGVANTKPDMGTPMIQPEKTRYVLVRSKKYHKP